MRNFFCAINIHRLLWVVLQLSGLLKKKFPESYRCAANSLGKGMPLHSNKFESDALVKKVLNIFLLFRQYLHLEILMALHLNYFKSTSPKGALC